MVFKVLKDGFVGKISQICRREPSKNYWEHAMEKHHVQTVEDIRITIKVMQVFLLLPIFFSLLDQGVSRWVLQAELLNRDFYFFTITGDQIAMLNSLFTLSMIPIFQLVIYPGCRKIGISMKPIEHKITIGLALTGLSFLLSTLLQLGIDQSPPQTIHVVAAVCKTVYGFQAPSVVNVRAVITRLDSTTACYEYF
jgi:dipeptide/tripeptide permease